MNKRYVVELSPQQRERCSELVTLRFGPGTDVDACARLAQDRQRPRGPGWTDAAIAEALEISTQTVAQVRQCFVAEGLEAALSHYRGPNREYPHKLDGRQEAHLLALARQRPSGRASALVVAAVGGQDGATGVCGQPLTHDGVSHAKKGGTEALASHRVVHSPGSQRGVRVADGRRVGCLLPPV